MALGATRTPNWRSRRDKPPRGVQIRVVVDNKGISSPRQFDPGTSDAKTLVDFNLFSIGREGRFGIEMRSNNRTNELYDRATRSFLEVSKRAVEVA